jgi:hypothetical protein
MEEEDVMEEEDNGNASHAMEICSDVETESNCIIPVIENLAEFLNSPFVEKMSYLLTFYSGHTVFFAPFIYTLNCAKIVVKWQQQN